MQKHKQKFSDTGCSNITLVDVQRCVRLHDLDELDGHHLGFHMIGLFSFRHWQLKDGIQFFYEFLNKLGITPDYVTIHPDKMTEWIGYYDMYKVEVRPDTECIWSDGTNESYCTEFYYKDVEIGNIVNPFGTCLDVGFGLERIEQFVSEIYPMTNHDKIRFVLECLVNEGILPGPTKQGYILRRLIRKIIVENGYWNNELFDKEKDRFLKQQKKYNQLSKKHNNQPSEWWWETHGIDITGLS